MTRIATTIKLVSETMVTRNTHHEQEATDTLLVEIARFFLTTPCDGVLCV